MQGYGTPEQCNWVLCCLPAPGDPGAVTQCFPPAASAWRCSFCASCLSWGWEGPSYAGSAWLPQTPMGRAAVLGQDVGESGTVLLPPHSSPSPFPLPVEAEDIKVCPRCSAFIMKINDGSCNRMNCTVCGCLFCWLCLQEISDVHFLRSVQGCGALGAVGCAGGLV